MVKLFLSILLLICISLSTRGNEIDESCLLHQIYYTTSLHNPWFTDISSDETIHIQIEKRSNTKNTGDIFHRINNRQVYFKGYFLANIQSEPVFNRFRFFETGVSPPMC